MKQILLVTFLTLFFTTIYAQDRTMKEQMERVKKQYSVNFVYDSSLDIDRNYIGGTIKPNDLNSALERLFKGSDIIWSIKGEYILLRQAKRYKLGGVIRDAETKEPLIGVTVIERSTTNNGTYTNPQGFFSITLTEGKRTVECRYLNCETKMVEIDISSDSLINIEMKPSVMELSEIVVVSNIDTKRIGELNLLAQKIKSIPAMFGESDVIKALQYIPGVQSSTEGKSDLIVRGGNPDQNLVLLDGIPIYNMNHVFGFFSIFNTDAIRGVSFYKSSFPARFGERLSSVVDIHTKEGNKEKFTGSASLGLLAAKLNLEIPIIKERTSLMLSARRSFLDLFMAEFQEPENIINFHFYDINAKLHHKFSDRASLSLIAYNGRDILSNKYAADNNANGSSPIKSDIAQAWTWGNTIASAQMEYIATPALALKGAFSYNRYHYNSLVDHTLTDDLKEQANTANPNYGDTSSDKTTQFNKLDYSSQIEDYSFKFGGDYALSNNHYIRFGGTATLHHYRPEILVQKNNISPDGNSIEDNEMTPAGEYAIYLEDDWNISKRLRANLGFRYSLYHVDGKNYSGFDPRVSLSYRATNDFKIKAGYSIVQQYIHLLSSSSTMFQTDLWVPATAKVPPMNSTQYTIGGYLKLPKGFAFSTELYYKDMKNIIEYRDGATFEGAQSGWEDKVAGGKGRAYGVEFLLERKLGRTTAAISYALSKSERFIDGVNDDKWFSSKYDRRHSINVHAAHRFNKKWEVFASWCFQSGSLITLPLETISNPEIPFDNRSNAVSQDVEQVSSRYNYQFPVYHRLDIGVNYTRNGGLKDRYGVWNLSVNNVYNRMNAWNAYLAYDIESSPHLYQLTLFPIIPSISYTYYF